MLLDLAHAADRVSDWARHCLADLDAGREPKLGTLTEMVEKLKAEIARFEAGH
jgi:hypothetical protein